jgi:hypothetical protein
VRGGADPRLDEDEEPEEQPSAELSGELDAEANEAREYAAAEPPHDTTHDDEP